MTEDTPKALLPVAGHPFAHWQLTWLAAHGVNDVVYCIGHLGAQIREFVGDGSRWGLAVSYSEDGDRRRSTAGALAHAARLGLLGESFLVIYGDSYLDIPLREFWQSFCTSDRPMLLSVYRDQDGLERANVRFRDGMVELYDKRLDDPGAAGMHHVDYGLMALDRTTLLQEVPDDGEHDLSDIQHRLSLRGDVAGFEAVSRFYEVGSPAGLADLDRLLAGLSGQD